MDSASHFQDDEFPDAEQVLLFPTIGGFGMLQGINADGATRSPCFFFVNDDGTQILNFVMCGHTVRKLVEAVELAISAGAFSYDDCDGSEHD